MLAPGELEVTGRVDRVDVDPASGEAIVRDYKGASAPKGAGWAEGGALQVALYMLAARELLGLRAGRRALPAAVGQGLAPARARARRRRRAATSSNDVVDEAGLEEALGEIRERALSTAEALRGGRIAPCAGALLAERLRVSDDLPGGRMSVAVRPAGGVAFTAEQRAAIDDRAGSALLAANAGSGKTAVMAERCVEAVLHDGVAVGSILALTFTEKAAGELRDRIRRRFVALGEDEHARAVDAGWIGTIHGFCARVLRARPLAAGLDPRFEVLDEPAAERLAGEAYERAFEDVGARARGAGDRRRRGVRPRPARHRPGRPRDAALARRDAPRAARAAARAARPTPLALSAARGGRRAHLADGRQRAPDRGGPARRSTRASALLGSRAAVPVPTALDGGGAQEGREGAGGGAERGLPRRPRGLPPALRRPPRARRARADRRLLERFGERYAEAKARRAGARLRGPRAGGARPAAADPEDRRRWSERFALIMVDEFQDTNRLQLDVLEALERDNLFAVGDEFQSIYGFRHADVTIFRERRAALGEAACGR